VLLGAMYMAFIFGLLYLCLTAFVLVFQVVYVVNSDIGGPAWLVTVFGEFLSFPVVATQKKSHIRKLEANNIPISEWPLTAICQTLAITGRVFSSRLLEYGTHSYRQLTKAAAPVDAIIFLYFNFSCIFPLPVLSTYTSRRSGRGVNFRLHLTLHKSNDFGRN
jgi:hypothetical protein